MSLYSRSILVTEIEGSARKDSKEISCIKSAKSANEEALNETTSFKANSNKSNTAQRIKSTTEPDKSCAKIYEIRRKSME